MASLLIALMMQYVVATKAGLVNDARGLTNVKANQMVAPQAPVRTGPTGYTEVLLTPGSYLRLGPNAEAVLDNVELTSVDVHLNVGKAIVEVVEIDSQYPIHITTGRTTVQLGDPGIFAFHDGVVTVIEGKLETVGETRTTYKKGWDVSYSLNYRAKKTSETELTANLAGLDKYSEGRSGLMARASVDLIPVIRRTTFTGTNAMWLFSPSLGMMTYIPLRNVRSPYGYRYTGLGYTTTNFNTASNNNADASRGSSSGASSNGGSGSSGGASGGGSPTFSTPSGGSTSAGGYVGGKSSTVGSTQGPPPQQN